MEEQHAEHYSRIGYITCSTHGPQTSRLLRPLLRQEGAKNFPILKLRKLQFRVAHASRAYLHNPQKATIRLTLMGLSPWAIFCRRSAAWLLQTGPDCTPT